MYAKTDEKQYVRELKSGALLNNGEDWARYKARRLKNKDLATNAERINVIENDVRELKEQITTILDIVSSIKGILEEQDGIKHR